MMEKTFFIRNIPHEVSADDLIKAFSMYGTVEKLDLPVQTKNQKKKKKDKSATLVFKNCPNIHILFDSISFGKKKLCIKPIEGVTGPNPRPTVSHTTFRQRK